MAKYTERAAGTYPCRFTKLDEQFILTDKQTGEDVTRWRWVFQEIADPTTAGELDTITSVGFRPRSNGLKFLMGMLGGPPPADFDTDTLIGSIYDVQYGPNQNGTLTIIGVTKPRVDPTLPQTAEAFAASNKGDLPF